MKTLTLICILALSVASISYGADRNTFVSDVDKSLTIHRIGIIPPSDNLNGLYSRYVEDKLREKIKKSHRFDLKDVKNIEARSTLEDYQDNPELVKKVGASSQVEALISARVNKTAENLILIVDLFLTKDGKLFSQEEVDLSEKTGTTELERNTTELYDKVIGKLPYKGLVLSREGNRVTVDLGTQDGIKDNTVLSVAQVISLKRHPKFNFVLSTEKEILGKIRVVKADETLSFGLVLQEQERGVIQVDSKISGLDFVAYPDSMGPSTNPDTLGDTVSFGRNPREWKPTKKPGFGKVGFDLGLGSLTNSITMQGAGSLSSSVSIYPQMNLTGELWLTPQWFIAGRLEEGIMSISNPLGGSTPGSLNATNSHYSLHGGYKFFLEDDYWGPQIDLYLGFGKYSFFVDSSTPTAFTSFSYYGLYFGLNGSLPVTADKTWYIDASLTRYLSPGETETPVTSGSTTDNSATEFGIGGSHKITESLWIQAHFDFEIYNTTYTGPGTRLFNGAQDNGQNSSQNLFTLLGGIVYYF